MWPMGVLETKERSQNLIQVHLAVFTAGLSSEFALRYKTDIAS